jgi:hypothetical protein
MANVVTKAIEHELDRIKSLSLEELRLEWRRLYTAPHFPQVEADD